METITAYALDLSMFLNESELTERRAFIESFVKEIVVVPDNAMVRYTIPMPDDSPIPGRDAEEMALNGSVLSTVKFGGPLWTALEISTPGPSAQVATTLGPAIITRRRQVVAVCTLTICQIWPSGMFGMYKVEAGSP